MDLGKNVFYNNLFNIWLLGETIGVHCSIAKQFTWQIVNKVGSRDRKAYGDWEGNEKDYGTRNKSMTWTVFPCRLIVIIRNEKIIKQVLKTITNLLFIIYLFHK